MKEGLPPTSSEVLVQAEGPGWNQELGRFRVPGGWLYTLQVHSLRGVSAALQFIPDGAQPAPPMGENETRLRAAVEAAAEWHEAERDTLGKQPPGGDRDWRRQQHREQHEALIASLGRST